jgi:hypothetical protein
MSQLPFIRNANYKLLFEHGLMLTTFRKARISTVRLLLRLYADAGEDGQYETAELSAEDDFPDTEKEQVHTRRRKGR